MNEEPIRKILVIGAGGIGGNLSQRLCRAVAFSGGSHPHLKLTIMDADLVEERNLPHQPFSVRDVGKPKVEAIAKNLKRIGITRKRGVKVVPIAEDFSSDTDLSDYDLVVVAVDREEPRRLVREKASNWLDLRATGDGLLLLSHEAPKSLVESIPSDENAPPASCQRPGAIESGNIQFGFSEAASHGAEWIVQRLNGRKVPSNRMYYINLGQKSFPRIAGGVGE
ncbi:MAG: ThiF family adenylyltransferase [Candidatus Thermoplasmatota archaeon]|nr:ThiF family adenylyltransferase [Candidatus Thermoplasmatota archaeon]